VAGNDHLSRALLAQTPHATNPKLGNGPFPPASAKSVILRRRVRFLFGLSPSGVYHAPSVAFGPVVS